MEVMVWFYEHGENLFGFMDDRGQNQAGTFAGQMIDEEEEEDDDDDDYEVLFVFSMYIVINYL